MTQAELDPAKPQIQTGSYRHYKGGVYHVFGIVRHTETREWMVLYGKGDEPEWARPFLNFTQRVQMDKDASFTPRFEFIDRFQK